MAHWVSPSILASCFWQCVAAVVIDICTSVQWLIISGRDNELAQLLAARPSAALLPLECGKSALDLV